MRTLLTGFIHLALEPAFNHLDNISFLIRRQGVTFRDSVPFLQAATAAAGSRVLGDKYRMPAKRGLFAVIVNYGRRQAFGYEVSGVADDCGQAFGLQVNEVLALEMEFSAESRL